MTASKLVFAIRTFILAVPFVLARDILRDLGRDLGRLRQLTRDLSVARQFTREIAQMVDLAYKSDPQDDQ